MVSYLVGSESREVCCNRERVCGVGVAGEGLTKSVARQYSHSWQLFSWQDIFFLVSARTHSISRYIHIQTLCVHKPNVLTFLQHGTYHVVVRGGSHFCQSPKGGGSGVFLLKRKGRPTLFWKKNTKIPQPSPTRKNVPSLIQ